MKIIHTLLFNIHFNIAADAAADKLLEKVLVSPYRQLPSDCCPVCRKKYKSSRTLKQHILNKHPDSTLIQGVPAEEVDLLENHTHQLLKVLLIKRSMDYAIKSGNGKVLSLLMKLMILYYREGGYKNYALACFEHIAQIQLFLSERNKELIMFDCFVNNRGKRSTNMAMDLDLEHSNKFFKDNFKLQATTPPQNLLDRLSFAQDKLERVLTNFYSQFGIHRHSQERSVNAETYRRDIIKLKEHFLTSSVFVHTPQRRMFSPVLMKASHDPLTTVDMYDLKQWFQQCIDRMTEQPFLQASSSG